MKWIVITGFILFVGYIIYGTIAPAQVQCEVCLRFEDGLVCRTGAGESEDVARRAAQESTCGGNTNGMSDMIACRNAEPVSVECVPA